MSVIIDVFVSLIIICNCSVLDNKLENKRKTTKNQLFSVVLEDMRTDNLESLRTLA